MKEETVNGTTLLIYARNSEGKMVYVDDVPNGKKCGCTCPKCKERLIAKNEGKHRIHHFAHNNGENCEGARMSALHELAQQIIEEKKTIMLPNYKGEHYSKSTNLVTFDKVILEKRIDIQNSYRRPDCIGYRYGKDGKEHRLWIEILVTHEVDEEKQNAIKTINESCIEVDLSDMLNTQYTKESIANRLLENKQDRRWINCPRYDEQERQLKEEIEHKKLEQQRKKEEEIKKQAKEREKQRILEEQTQRDRKNRIKKWFIDGNSLTTEFIINEINSKPYSNEKSLFGDPTKNVLCEELIHNDDFLFYLDNSPKNSNGLSVFYTLLDHYHGQITDIRHIRQRLDYYKTYDKSLTDEEKIELEELLALRIVYNLVKNREKYRNLSYPEDYYEQAIQYFIFDKGIRNEVLMAASVFYHHIVGSNVKTFGELTKEVIQSHPAIAHSFLSFTKCNNIPNDYFIENYDILHELSEFVNKNDKPEFSISDIILKECFPFAFESESEELNTPYE